MCCGGGAFNSDSSEVRSSDRYLYGAPTSGFNASGFRLAKTVDVKTPVAQPVSKPDPAAIMPAAGNLLIAPFTEEKAKEAQKEVAKSLQKEVEEKEELGKGIKLEMVLIPAGKFMMGSPLIEVGRNKDETQHEVTITKPFYMGKYEVTNELWRSVTRMNPPGPIRQNRGPVTDVSWKECQEFIKKLNEKTAGGYRLPTEAEWEYACRAGTTTAFSFGSSINKTLSNCDTTGDKQVGSYKPNAFGLYDMHGNVWEWCNDVYGPYSIGAVEDPVGALNGTNRVLRGSSCMSVNQFLRSAARVAHPETAPPAVLYYKGFRLAKAI